ncbi:CrcB family protein [Listeria aquatica]|uniref:Fluoride-specific ion channel n=1 Tax=Listeria aquatica FSL S10-1188 TaxID=1265818 RepID=W7BJ12_9LIST|nr:camphor resistance protein CrcB [Listeria aquatica FSL S10-1188]
MYLLYIAIFSALGGMARYGVSLILPSNTFPLATLVVNLLGCFFACPYHPGFCESYPV